MEAGLKQRSAEALVHMNYANAYANALEKQSTLAAPQERKQAAAAIVAEAATTANRDASAINRQEASAGRELMEKVYGKSAADKTAVLSGRVAGYEFPQAFEGTKDLSALSSKAQILVNAANIEAFADRGRVTQIGSGANYLDVSQSAAQAETKEKLVNHMLHVKAAVEAGVDKKQYDKQQGEMVYQRFQNAAFDLGAKKQMNAEFANFEKGNTTRLREDVMKEVDARYEAQQKTIARAKEKEADPANKTRADSFRNMPQEEAIKKHPELAGAYAAAAAVDKKAEADGYNPQQREALQKIVKANIATNIEKGQIPDMKMREEKQVTATKSADQER